MELENKIDIVNDVVSNATKYHSACDKAHIFCLFPCHRFDICYRCFSVQIYSS